MKLGQGMVVLVFTAGCASNASPADAGHRDHGVLVDEGVTTDHGSADTSLATDGGGRPTDGSVCLPEPRLWNGDHLSPIQVGSFCDDVTFGSPSSAASVDGLEGLSERFTCSASDTTITCVFYTDADDPHLTRADMEILCAAEDAVPALDWSCTDAA